MRKKTCWKYY